MLQALRVDDSIPSGPSMIRLPNFFLVGAPKAGTTSLYHYLDQHPQICMSPIKEPNFFAAEIRQENFDAALRRGVARDARSLREYLDGPMRKKRFGGIVANWEDYLRLFANANNQTALGEASVCNLWSPTASERIAARIPNAKILVMLRDPAERAYSQYLHGVGNGAIRWSFREHIERNLRHRCGQFCVHYPFLEFGLYSQQLSRYLERFGENVWIGFYEDFNNRPVNVCQDIFRFLGVSDEFSPDMDTRHLEAQIPRLGAIAWLMRSGFRQAAARVTPSSLRPVFRRALMRKAGKTTMNPSDRDYLRGFYREDIGKLASLVGHNLDRWQRVDLSTMREERDCSG
jgi:Sulfotransferase family